MSTIADLIDAHHPEDLPEYEPAYRMPILDDDDEEDDCMSGSMLNFG